MKLAGIQIGKLVGCSLIKNRNYIPAGLGSPLRRIISRKLQYLKEVMHMNEDQVLILQKENRKLKRENRRLKKELRIQKSALALCSGQA